MKFSPAKNRDLHTIMSIVHEAQIHLASQDINQWQCGYPDEKLILEDISNQDSYIVKNEDNNIMGIAMFTTKPESNYSVIDGSWQTEENAKYGVIHRMAVGSSYKKLGVAKFIFSKCEQILKKKEIDSMRIDTHEDNIEMQGLLIKSGYIYCGIIFLDDGDKRLAFEKIL